MSSLSGLLKPELLAIAYVRMEGRTLQKNQGLNRLRKNSCGGRESNTAGALISPRWYGPAEAVP